MYSIIIPSYNRGYCIERAVQSAINQNWGEISYEIIVVDDGSTDDTVERLRKYVENSQIRLVRIKKNRGVCHAKNTGVLSASGEYVWFLDSDDMLADDAVQQAEAALAEYPGLVGYFFGCRYLDGKPTFYIKEDAYVMRSFREYFDKSNCDGEFTGIIKREAMLEFPFNEELNGFEGVTWFQLEKRYYDKWIFINRVLSIVDNTTQDSLMRGKITREKVNRNINGMKWRLQIMGDDLKKYQIKGKDGLAMQLAILGKYYMLIGKLKEGFSYTWKSFMYNPFELRVYRNVLLGLSGRKIT